MTKESARLQESYKTNAAWRKWGPYLSERQWGTVREDYSEKGDAWEYFPHEQSRFRAYRWGEDGLGGISDDKQLLCFALALWNENDPIIKERLFGLTNSEGNHGEDVKEYYYYLDSTPTHSYMRYLYKYPQAAFPYVELIKTNQQRNRNEKEFELIDTGVFDQDKYFDCFIEYAKESPEDILIEINLINRSAETAKLHVLPTLWFRNLWSWGGDYKRPVLQAAKESDKHAVIKGSHEYLGKFSFYCEGHPELLFTENESNTEKFSDQKNASPYVKDAFHRYLIEKEKGAINPQQTGTKTCAHYDLSIPAGQTVKLKLRLTFSEEQNSAPFGTGFEKIFSSRKKEADDFYSEVIPENLDQDSKLVMRQALAGMLWTKQFYYYDLQKWLEERGSDPLQSHPKPSPRNDQWHHMYNAHVISMPDKWEYPWYAAWDLAFHMQALSLVDINFCKQQLDLMLKEHYMHPNGQIPAYEWNFGDVNPPVHAWATSFTYREEKGLGKGDTRWLERAFQKLLLNFTWWVNRKDRYGKNVFEGGFLGLDNIGVFDRSKGLPSGSYLEQADGTAWMTLFCQNMLEISLELAKDDPSYAEMTLKFMQHSLWIASSMIMGRDGVSMWDENDGFFYDVLRLPNGKAEMLKVRSVVGLLPLCAVTVFDQDQFFQYPDLVERFRNFLAPRMELMDAIHDSRKPGYDKRLMSAILNESRLRRVLSIMLDESEFLSPYGIRSLSKRHAEHPYYINIEGAEYCINYQPAESESPMFGGNSNWRGPIWAPINAMVIRALLEYYSYYGDSFKIECPTGSGKQMTLFEVAKEITHRINSIFLKDKEGKRPIFTGYEKFQNDPNWSDYVLFYEYFHGDNGSGLGASHQTGWSGIVARSLHMFATMSAKEFLEAGKVTAIEE